MCKEMEMVNVPAKVEVTKPFVQEAELAKKLEAFKVKAAGAEKHENSKEKGKEVIKI